MNSAASPLRVEQAERRAAPSYRQIIRILNMVREEAEIADIEEELKADPVIIYRLLTHVNSAGMGFPREIKSFRQAVTILGLHQLYRWLAMLLVTADPGEGGSVTGRNAIIRGRFLELVGKAHFRRERADDLFVVGAFSLLDVLLGEPMETLLEELSISDTMRAALLRQEGPYAPLLRLAESIEQADEARIDAALAGLPIPIDVIYDTYEEALDWAGKLGV